jgi:Sulfotransferase domain
MKRRGPLTRAERARIFIRPRRRFRLATKRFRMLPSFLIIGAQRAGTTSLYHYMSAHPDVDRSTSGIDGAAWNKELHFFDDRFALGLIWYKAAFPLLATERLTRLRGRRLVTGEATPSYLFHPLVPGRVAETLPEVRLIAVLRDPVERAYSHYQLMRREGPERFSFAEAIAAEEERLAGEEERILADPAYRGRKYRNFSYVKRGLYAEQLERWFEHFPREQLLVLRFEDLLARPAQTYAEVLEFLGLQPHRLDAFGVHNQSKTAPAPIEPQLRARLRERFADPNARLEDLLGWDCGWDDSDVKPTSLSASAADA